MARTHPKHSVSRDFVLLFVVIVAIIALVALWVAYKTFDNYTDSVVSDLEGEAIRVDRSLIVEIKSASYLIESLSRQIIQIGAEDYKGISRLLRSFNGSSNRSDMFSWINPSGDIVVNGDIGMLERLVNVSDRDYVKKALTSPWQVHLGRPVASRLSERRVLPLSVGVTDKDGTFVGTLVMSIDISRVTKELRQVIQEEGIEFAIYTDTMNIIADSRNDETQDTIEPLGEGLPSVIDNRDSPKGVLTTPDLFSPSVPFTYYERSSQYPYIVYIRYDQMDASDEIFELMRARLVQIMIISVFLLALLWMVRTRIIRPVEELSYLTSRIAAGERYTPLPHGGPVEIESLAIQIRKLSDYIDEQYRIEEELKRKNAFLSRLKDSSRVLTQARSHLLASVAKELQKPADRAKELVQRLQQTHQGAQVGYHQEFRAEMLEIHTHLEQVHQIADDIYEITATDHSAMILRESSVNISYALHRAVRKFHEASQYRHIEVKLKLDDVLPKLLIDEERFVEGMIHLLCASAASLMQGTPIELGAHIERNAPVQRQLVVQLKYLTQHHSPTAAVLTGATTLPPSVDTPHLTHDKTSLAYGEMLFSLYDAEIHKTLTKGDVQRLVIRFPDSRLI